MLHVVPHNVALDDAAIVEPLVTAYHAVGAAKVTDWASKSVLIIGGGPVGLFLLLALRAEKVSQILVSEPTEARRKVLLDLADVVIDPRADDVAEVCRKTTNDHGADVVYDCAGVPQSITAAFQATRIGGTYVNVAVWEKPVSQGGQ
jgi:threonine dehydrogenase-like Zn-dependent dehydrogenase